MLAFSGDILAPDSSAAASKQFGSADNALRTPSHPPDWTACVQFPAMAEARRTARLFSGDQGVTLLKESPARPVMRPAQRFSLSVLNEGVVRCRPPITDEERAAFRPAACGGAPLRRAAAPPPPTLRSPTAGPRTSR
ncbi:unnamed protein product [Prorocentrum cordatum]|uniref:Uncharacterized protein n=1 Tax=Prorocentrum cordatum TaxID=2364126 RepID=A0ABN9PJG1_9DINO|nr:unnamed protein product [Polarella glacialis]